MKQAKRHHLPNARDDTAGTDIGFTQNLPNASPVCASKRANQGFLPV